MIFQAILFLLLFSNTQCDNRELYLEALRSQAFRRAAGLPQTISRPEPRLLHVPYQYGMRPSDDWYLGETLATEDLQPEDPKPQQARAVQEPWTDPGEDNVASEEAYIQSLSPGTHGIPEHKKSLIHNDVATAELPKTTPLEKKENFKDILFVAIVAGCSAAAIIIIIGAGICFYKIQQQKKAVADVEYPAYGVTGPGGKDSASSSPPGDRKLAHSAHMYHYQHQKQQMIAVEKAQHGSASDGDSEEENEEGDYTVYECPGLASTVEMEVKNPLFQDDSTPMSPPTNN